MKILDTFFLESRKGWLAFVEIDFEPLAVGKELVRKSDGARWRIDGIEFYLHRPPRRNDRVGLLLRGEAAFKEGDEIELAPHPSSATSSA
jgi:hypothetical protein